MILQGFSQAVHARNMDSGNETWIAREIQHFFVDFPSKKPPWMEFPHVFP